MSVKEFINLAESGDNNVKFMMGIGQEQKSR